MKAIVNDKKHITLVSHTNGVVIVEESACIIDLDFQSLASICEIANLGNTYTIKDCDEIESLKSNNNELTERIKFLEGQLTNSGNRITELRNQIEEQENEYKDIIVKKDKIIEEKTNSLIKLENIEDTLNATVKVNEELNTQLSRSKEDIDKLDKQLEEKTSRLAERTHALRVFRRALYDMRLYVQPYKKYELDFEWLTIRNSIDSGFFIRFKDSNISVYDIVEKFKYEIAHSNVY